MEKLIKLLTQGMKSLFLYAFLMHSGFSFASNPIFFDKLDINNDGFISINEHGMITKKIFDHIDSNKDGIMSAQEMTNNDVGKYIMKSESMSNLGDFDKDGRITVNEYTTLREQQFMMADVNQDKKISKSEMNVFHKYSVFSKMDDDNDTCITPKEFVKFDFKYIK